MEDSLDLSIGLSSALQYLAQYRQSGILQAEKLRIAQMHGHCTGSIRILAGSIIACFIQNRDGERQLVEVGILTQLDKEKGPFEWRFFPERQQQPQSETQKQMIPYAQAGSSRYPRELASDAIPLAIAELNLDWLTAWSPQQRRALRMVYSMVNGQRTIAAIESFVPLPTHIVQQALLVLISMKVIEIRTYR